MNPIASMVLGGLAFLVVGALMGFVYAVPVWLLWGWLAPEFGLVALGYLKCWGLTYLCGLLFKSS